MVAIDSVYVANGRVGGPRKERLFTNLEDLATCFDVAWRREIGSSGPLPFDERATEAQVASRPVRTCETTQHPPVDVTVTFAPSGLVRRIDVPSPLVGTPLAACIDSGIHPVQIAPFSGALDKSVTHSFALGPRSDRLGP